MRQWAYEWRKLMDANGSPYSSFPYHFVDVSQERSGIIAQLSEQQSEVYQSAFLRTLACAVDKWKYPVGDAALDSTLTLPANLGLVGTNSVQRPEWLADLPERCCEPNSRLQELGKELLEAADRDPGWRLISLRSPIAARVARYAELSISAILASKDYQPDLDNSEEEDGHRRILPWPLADGLSFRGEIDIEPIADFASPGRVGEYAPMCVSVWPLPSGFWHGDLFQVGLSIPAPYLFETPISLACEADGIVASRIGSREPIASTCMWYDHWTPLHPRDGATRCGVLTRLQEPHLTEALRRHGRRMDWIIELRMWRQTAEYEPFEMTKRRAHFIA